VQDNGNAPLLDGGARIGKEIHRMQLLPRPIFEGPEGLRVVLDPDGAAVFGPDRAHGPDLALAPDRAVALAFALLDTFAPSMMDAIEREVRAQRLRLVQGCEPGGDGA
jgi:hypothetical protein